MPEDSNSEVDVLLMTTNFGLELLQEPYGIGVLSAILQRHGFSTELLEPGVEALDWRQCAEVIRERRPKILGISMLFDTAVDDVIAMCREIRHTLPSTFIFLGGQAVTTRYYSRLYEPLTYLCNAIVVGEAERSAPQYVARLLGGLAWQDVPGLVFRNSNGDLIENAPAPRVENLNELPMQDRSVLRQIIHRRPGYKSAAVQAGRGCASSCSFCSYGILRRIQGAELKLRRRSFDLIFDEMRYLYEELGIRDFHIEDESLFENDAEYNHGLIWLAKQIQRFIEPITFDVLARIDCVDRDVCRELKAAGMTRVFAGVDSADKDDLILYNKGYTPAEVHEGMKTLLSLGYSLDVDAQYRLQTGYITWNPYSTLPRIRNALEFFKQYRNTPKLIQHYLFIFSGTPLKKRIENDGLALGADDVAEENRVAFRFAHENVGHLFHEMLAYFDVWSPFRDGIRMVEKVVQFELHNAVADTPGLVRVRKNLDQHFFDSFEEMLRCAESGASRTEISRLRIRAVEELHALVPESELDAIARFCAEQNLGGNIVDMVRENPLILARYKL